MRFIQYLNEAGVTAERQENGFVDLVNRSFQEYNNPIVIKSKTDTIKNVIGAEKYKGRQISGSEPYTDVVLFTTSKNINISMKGPSAPSLAGGGLRGIEQIIPGIADRFFKAVYYKFIKDGLQEGDKVPDSYGKLNDVDKKLLVIGNINMGGPIDYMYIGPMDVSGKFSNGILNVNGNLIEANKYADSHELYFRLRARRKDQFFDPAAMDKKGIPKIYSKSLSNGDSAGRLVITDKPVKSRDMIIF